jgi:hypothetical protein
MNSIRPETVAKKNCVAAVPTPEVGPCQSPMRQLWRNVRFWQFLSLIPYFLFTVSSLQAADFDHSHSSLEIVLKRFVKDGLVNYSALKASPAEVDSYLDQIAAVPKDDFRKWTEDQQLAFLINLYNAQTLRLIIEHYPVKSIKDIGSAFRGPWDQPVVRLFGEKTTLKHLESGVLSKDYQVPEIHFALVCASLGCPELRNESYVADKLPHQLTDQGRRFLAASGKNSIDLGKRIVYLSPIFKWFNADFVQKSGSILEFIQFYLTPELSEQIGQGAFKIKYTEYDWSLNDSKEPNH